MIDKATRHERILDCRYYNGENESPEGVNAMFWGYECQWANGNHENWECEKEDLKREGLQYFEAEDGTPYDFKCLLYNRYCHWNTYYTTEGFLRWYIEQYQKPRLTNRQRRALERKPKLITKCRYYKGEKENPYENTEHEMTWLYEKTWVERLSESYKNTEEWRYEIGNIFDDIIGKYHTPRSLVGLFFNRYCYWCSMGEPNIEAFRDWLLYVYLQIPQD